MVDAKHTAGVFSPVSFSVRQVAERLFVEHNRSNGALYPYGFGFLGRIAQEAWYEKARAALSTSTDTGVPHD